MCPVLPPLHTDTVGHANKYHDFHFSQKVWALPCVRYGERNVPREPELGWMMGSLSIKSVPQHGLAPVGTQIFQLKELLVNTKVENECRLCCIQGEDGAGTGMLISVAQSARSLTCSERGALASMYVECTTLQVWLLLSLRFWLHFSLQLLSYTLLTWALTKSQVLIVNLLLALSMLDVHSFRGRKLDGIWWLQDQRIVPCSVSSIWEEHHWAIPIISLGALKEGWCYWHALLGDVLGCLCPTHTF